MMIRISRIPIVLLALLGTPLTAAQGAIANPITFEAALGLATNAPDVVAAKAQLETALLSLEVVRSPIDANLGVSADQTWDLSGDSGGFSATASASATLNVLPYGPSADAATRAENAVTRARLALDATRADVVTTVAAQHATALRAAQNAEVLQAAFALAEARLEAVQAQREAGAANDAQVLQAQIGVTSAGNDLAEAERDTLAALTNLSQTLGFAIEAVEGALPAASPIEAFDTSDRVLDRRDVIAAQLAITEAELALAAARRDASPSADLDLSYGATSGGASLQLAAGFDTRSYQPTLATSIGLSGGANDASSSRLGVSVGLNIPFDAARGANLATYELALEEAEANLDRTVATATAEIENLQRAVESAEAQVVLTGRLVEQTETSVEAARTQLELGLVSTLDVQEAEISLLEARLQRDRAQDAYLETAMTLATAVALDPLAVLP
jgi:outer membrane protein